MHPHLISEIFFRFKQSLSEKNKTFIKQIWAGSKGGDFNRGQDQGCPVMGLEQYSVSNISNTGNPHSLENLI